MLRTTALVLVIGLLAGCSTFGGAIDEPTRVSVTPAPVPTAVPTQASASAVAPGVSDRGVVDPLALAAAHETALSNRSETVLLRREVRYADGEIHSRRVQFTRVAANRSRFHTVITVGGAFPPFHGDRLEFYADGDTLYQATILPSQNSYFRVPLEEYRQRNDVDVILSSPDASTVFLLFTVVEARLTATFEIAGLTRYRFRGTRMVQPAMLAEAEDVDDPRNLTFTAIIDERGVLRQFTLRYEADIDGRPVTVIRTGTHTAIGETTVDPPAWIESAVNRTG